MRKFTTVVLGVFCMAYIAACGSSSSTSYVTEYDLPALAAITPQMGGAIQTPPVFSKPVKVFSPAFAGSIAGFNNVSSAGVATFNRPVALASDGTNLYVADYMNHAIRRIHIATQRVFTIGNANGLPGSSDTAPGVTPGFNLPSGITTDGANLYVADSGNYTIRKIEFDAGGVAKVSTLAGTAGQPGTVDAVGAAARFNVISGITTDGVSLYVTDSNNTIRRVVIATGKVTTLAGAPGTSGSADGVKDTARFNLPARLTTDGRNLYVTDFGNSTIRKIDLTNGMVTTIAGKVGPGGSAGTHADSTDVDPTGQSARFNQPNGITCDGTNLYVTDSYDNTVRKIVLPVGAAVYSGPVTTLTGIGSTALNSTVGITTDGTSLFVTDITATTSGHTVIKIQ